MCFCASGSLAAGAGLAVVGIATIALSHKRERLFAIIPLLFAVQQLIEGGQWLAPHPSVTSIVFGYGFLFFAFVLWPVYVPLAVYQLENDPHIRSLLKWVIGAGAVTSFSLLIALLTRPLVINILSNGIDYRVETPLWWVGVLLYLAATVGPLTISSHPRIRWFGAMVTLSIAFTAWAFRETFISVWCFFAAILSVTIYFFYRQRSKRLLRR